MKQPEQKIRLIGKLRALFTLEFTRRLHEGGQKEFEIIYRKFRHPLRNWVSKKIPNAEMSDEITQEVFLKAWRSRTLFHPAFELSTWIWSIARNTVIDVFRRSDWNRTIIQGSDHFDIDPVPLLETLAHPGETPENELSARLEKAHLARGLAQLTELQRRALNLRLIEQLPYEEIAEQLELSLSSVKGLIFRAKQRLLDEMREPQATPG